MRCLPVLLSLTLLTWGCATKKYVASEIETSELRTQDQLEEVRRAVEETQTEIRDLSRELDVKIEGIEADNAELKARTEKNAEEIVKLGYVSFKKTFSDSEAYFRSDSAGLNPVASEELDKFAALIKGQKRRVFIEIQGHTDNRGPESHNRMLGEKRAIAVREYLYKNHDIPLHIMSVISMGADDPIADNGTREGRAKNRRVVLVVRVQI